MTSRNTVNKHRSVIGLPKPPGLMVLSHNLSHISRLEKDCLKSAEGFMLQPTLIKMGLIFVSFACILSFHAAAKPPLPTSPCTRQAPTRGARAYAGGSAHGHGSAVRGTTLLSWAWVCRSEETWFQLAYPIGCLSNWVLTQRHTEG